MNMESCITERIDEAEETDSWNRKNKAFLPIK